MPRIIFEKYFRKTVTGFTGNFRSLKWYLDDAKIFVQTNKCGLKI